ncbi:MAG: TylF/MycF/NovP-related O-methyltransferase [Usitatibacter sp.]
MQQRLSPVLESALRNAGVPRLLLSFPFILALMLLQWAAFRVAPGYMGRRQAARNAYLDQLMAWQQEQLVVLRAKSYRELAALPGRTELDPPPRFKAERLAIIRSAGPGGGVEVGVALFTRFVFIVGRLMPSFEMLPNGAIVGESTPAEPARVDESPTHKDIPEEERHLYQPTFIAWLADQEFQKYFSIANRHSLVSVDRCHVLYTLLLQSAMVPGDVWECGVYKGGTAAMMAAVMNGKIPSKRLYLFDTFSGMPETDPTQDWHKEGDFSDTSLEAVRNYVGHPDTCVFRQGFIPETFAGLEASPIAMAHIDVDTYRSVLDCVAFIWPRLPVGGLLVFDDYGFPTCRGARVAVDEFFAATGHKPLSIPTGQALVFKSAPSFA